MNNNENNTTLKRQLSPMHVWAIAFGCVIGWGSFINPGKKFLPNSGVAGTAIAMVLGALVMIVIAMSYAYMVPKYPKAGGEFTFTKAFEALDEFKPAYLATILVAYVPVAFVVFAEHLADHKNLSSIIDEDLLENPGLHRTLLGDGVGSMAGAFFGGCPNTTYGESVGCVAITRNASVITITTAAILCMVISFFGPFVTFLASIPNCIMGGVCVTLYGFIACSGLKMIQGVDLNQNKNLFVVAVILITGIGGLSVSFGDVTLTSIACALILGIVTNLLLNKGKEE